MQKQKILWQSLLLFFMVNVILLIQILPQVNAKYVKQVSYRIRKDTKAEVLLTTFSYKGEEEEFIAPYTGYYAVQLWGADGRPGESSFWGVFTKRKEGGEGGYIAAQIYLKRGEVLSVRVGGTSIGDSITKPGYNAGIDGGGFGSYGELTVMGYAGGGGGGATDIRINGERVLVAGGGGGGSSGSNTNAATGGAGGNAGEKESADGSKGSSEFSGAGGSSIAGGAGGIQGSLGEKENERARLTGDLERGGSSEKMVGGSAHAGGGGGGGGYFGGGAARAAHDAGGGGSSMRIGPRMEKLSVIKLENLPENPVEDRKKEGNAKHGYAIISYLDPAP